MELFSSIIEGLSNLVSWLPLASISIIICLIIIVPFFKDGKDKSFILLSLVLNFFILIYMLLGGAYVTIIPFGIFNDFSISDLLPLFSLLIPLIMYSVAVIPYLIYKKIFTIRRYLKFMVLPILYILNMVIFTILFSFGIETTCGSNEACGYAVFGAFYFGPIAAIPANAFVSVIFYRRFVKNITVNSNEKIITFKNIIHSILFKIGVVTIILTFIGASGYFIINSIMNSSVSYWKTYSSQYYSFKYPPKGEVKILEDPGDVANYPDLEIKTNAKSEIERDSFDIEITRVDDNPFYDTLEKYWEYNKGYEFIEGTNVNSLKLKHGNLNGYPTLLASVDSEHILYIQGKNIILKVDLPFGFTSTEYDVPKESLNMLMKIAETIKIN